MNDPVFELLSPPRYKALVHASIVGLAMTLCGRRSDDRWYIIGVWNQSRVTCPKCRAWFKKHPSALRGRCKELSEIALAGNKSVDVTIKKKSKKKVRLSKKIIENAAERERNLAAAKKLYDRVEKLRKDPDAPDLFKDNIELLVGLLGMTCDALGIKTKLMMQGDEEVFSVPPKETAIFLLSTWASRQITAQLKGK